jgi:hypothetical protein
MDQHMLDEANLRLKADIGNDAIAIATDISLGHPKDGSEVTEPLSLSLSSKQPIAIPAKEVQRKRGSRTRSWFANGR